MQCGVAVSTCRLPTKSELLQYNCKIRHFIIHVVGVQQGNEPRQYSETFVCPISYRVKHMRTRKREGGHKVQEGKVT